MSFYNNRYYYFNKALLSILGLWPYQSRLESNIIIAITLSFLFSLTVLELWGLISGIMELSTIMENLSLLLINNIALIKMINGICNKYKMKDLLDRVKETWKIVQTGPQNEILRNYAEESRIFTKRYAMIFYSVWIFYCSMPSIVTRIYILLWANETYEAKFFYRIEHVIDMENYYKLLTLHMFISVFYIVTVVIAVDCLFLFYVQYVCALFENIRLNMERMQALNCVELRLNVADDEAYRIIVGCIKLYIRAL
ncbi:hypothetical protein HN011_011897, partial [Eciton burchellii]